MDNVDIGDFLRRQAVWVRRRERLDRRAEADWWVSRIEALKLERDVVFGRQPDPARVEEVSHVS